jgi:hypothetical protein
MEQQLINELIRMIAKMGGASLVKDLIEQVDHDGDPKSWTPEEIVNAYDYVKWQNTYFGEGDVTAIIGQLSEKYNLDADTLCKIAKA